MAEPTPRYRLLTRYPGVVPATVKNSIRARVRAPGNVDLSAPGAAVDGVALAANDIFWADAQTDPTEDGAYVFNGAAVAATRAPELPAGAEVMGLLVSIAEGTDGNRVLVVTNDKATDTIGTDGLTTTYLAASGSEAELRAAAAALTADLDVNGQEIVDVGAPMAAGSAARLSDTQDEANLRAAAAALTTSLNVNAQRVFNVAEPSAGWDAATRNYVDTKGRILVRVRAQGDVVLATPGAVVDGVALDVNDPFLAADQAVPTEDGVYLYQGAAVPAVRDPSFPTAREARGALVAVQEGTDADSLFLCTNNKGADVVGTDALTFAKLVTAASHAKLFRVTTPATKAVNAVHADFAGNDVSNNFPGGFTNPDVPRNVSVTFAAGWDGGNVNVVGTDIYDQAVNEDFVANPGNTEYGSKIFKTTVSATKGAVGIAADAASIGVGDKLGVAGNVQDALGKLDVAGVGEAVTVDPTYDAFTPTTVPNGATTYTVALNVL